MDRSPPRFSWDPGQYGRFADDRARPFRDLIARIGAEAPTRVVDLGCGDGSVTRLLRDRWPDAEIVGVDSSAEMLERAAGFGDARLRFAQADIADLAPDAAAEVVVSNAALQWVPGHGDVLRLWARALPRSAWIAFQVPGNAESPAHDVMREIASAPRWASRLDGLLRRDGDVGTPAGYARLLRAEGWTTDAWETTDIHVLEGADPVLEWLRGTRLRPVLAALDAAERPEFEALLAEGLRAAYPPEHGGTLFPFRRVFCVAHGPGAPG